MKIRGKGDVTDIQTARELVQQQELNRSSSTQDAERLAKKLKLQNEGSLIETSDQVDVSLAKAISTELSPEAMAAERRKRIDDLKTQIANGTYNPSSELVARAVGEEILLEIFSAGPEARSSE